MGEFIQMGRRMRPVRNTMILGALGVEKDGFAESRGYSAFIYLVQLGQLRVAKALGVETIKC